MRKPRPLLWRDVPVLRCDTNDHGKRVIYPGGLMYTSGGDCIDIRKLRKWIDDAEAWIAAEPTSGTP